MAGMDACLRPSPERHALCRGTVRLAHCTSCAPSQQTPHKVPYPVYRVRACLHRSRHAQVPLRSPAPKLFKTLRQLHLRSMPASCLHMHRDRVPTVQPLLSSIAVSAVACGASGMHRHGKPQHCMASKGLCVWDGCQGSGCTVACTVRTQRICTQGMRVRGRLRWGGAHQRVLHAHGERHQGVREVVPVDDEGGSVPAARQPAEWQRGDGWRHLQHILP